MAVYWIRTVRREEARGYKLPFCLGGMMDKEISPIELMNDILSLPALQTVSA